MGAEHHFLRLGLRGRPAREVEIGRDARNVSRALRREAMKPLMEHVAPPDAQGTLGAGHGVFSKQPPARPRRRRGPGDIFAKLPKRCRAHSHHGSIAAMSASDQPKWCASSCT